MTEITPCPESGRLKDLLAGTLPDEHQANLSNHLENCPICQEKLEGLAAGKDTWTYAAWSLNAGAEPPEIGLQRIIAETKEKLGEAETTAEATLDFLDPSEDPSHLGKLGQYEVIEVLGQGGMSVVLKAFDPSLHRMVAIKVLAPQLATTAAARIRFQREGYAAAAISHGHVVAVYGVDEVKGLPYLVMEYISGESLQERLDRSGPLELKEVLRIGMQTAQGLAAAHAQGLVHRDIKPANILLHNGVARVKITDFGLARAVDDATLTQSGLVAGTPQYMSPEQARGDAIDARTDLFSLGSVLYAMSTGLPPFRASTTMGVLKRVSEDSPRAVREVNADVPPWLAEIIGKLHARNPAERFQSAAEVADLLSRHLAEVQQGLPTAVPIVTPPALRPALRPSGLFRKHTWAIASTVLLPLIAGAFVVSEATGVTSVSEFVATVLRIKTPDGTLVIETDDPAIEVVVDGEDIKIHGVGPKEIRVKAGEHRIHATKDGKQVSLEQELITVTRGGRQIVRIRRENLEQAPADRGVEPVHGLPALSHVATLKSRTFLIRSLLFALDGKALISAGSDLVKQKSKEPKSGSGTIELWDLRMNKNSWYQKDPSPVQAATISPGSTTLVTGNSDGTVRFRNFDGGDLIKALHAGTGPVNAVTFAPDGQTLAAGSSDGNVRIIRVGTREILERFESGISQRILCLAYSPDGKTLAVGGFDRPRLVPGIEDIDGNKRTTDGNADISYVRLFEVGSWKARIVLAGHHGAVESLAFSPDGKLLATASVDKMVKLWRVADGKEIAALNGHTDSVNALAFSPDSTLLVSGGEDRTIKLWDVVRWKLLLSSPQDAVVHSLALSPDGQTLAVGGRYEIKLWNIASVYAQAAQRQRLATLRQSLARTEIAYKQGALPVVEVQKAKLAVLSAELDLCETPRERIAVLERILTHRREVEKLLETLYKSGAAPEASLLEARAKRQEAEIDVQRERAKVLPKTVVPGADESHGGGSGSKDMPTGTGGFRGAETPQGQ